MATAHIDKILTEQSPQKLHAYLKKQTIDSLASVSRTDPLEQLNPAVHSLGYLFILYSFSRYMYDWWLMMVERRE
jgi:hypothetical protein